MYKKLVLLFSIVILLTLNSCGEGGGSSSDTALITPVTPEILKSFYGKVDENASYGTTIGTVDLSSLITFEMKDIILSGDGSQNFKIDKSGLLILNRDAKIDYENKNIYNLALTVSDIEGNSKATVVTIEVVDIPEESPILANSSTIIDENLPADTIVAKVGVVSQGDSPIISMRLNGDNSSAFNIDKDGVIKVSKNAILDYETISRYDLLVTATNTSGDSQSATVTINIKNMGEIVPTIQGFDNSIFENSKSDSLIVGTVDIIDSGDSPITSMTLTGEGSQNFKIDSRYGMITLSDNSQIDYETTNIYNLQVVATNNAGSSQPQNITIRVTDKPDIIPILDTTNLEVQENTLRGTNIGKIKILNVGDSPISLISLSGSGADDFRVDRDGNIYIVGSPDYETKNLYTLDVIATNKAGDSQSKTLKISITDISDIVPIISSFSSNIVENSQKDTLLGRINIISSGDSPITAINLSGDGASDFRVTTSGDVYVLNPPDYENIKLYKLMATAVNNAGNSTPQNITIQIIDEADVVPSLNGFEVKVDENTPEGTNIGKIEIPSVGDSAISVINLSGEGADDFRVDTQGNIYVVKPADYETKNIYTLTATATNRGGESVAKGITINILDKPDVVPTLDNFSTNIYENSSVGSSIGKIPILDSGDSSILTIVLSGNDAKDFRVDTQGNIYIVKSPDYETKNRYDLEAIATNSGGSSIAKTLTILISDRADVVPIISDFSANIKENLAKDEIIGRINIKEVGDTSINSITLSGLGSSDFKVYTNGDVVVVNPPNYELQKQYRLSAVATNDAGDSSSKIISIQIEDLPDVPPTIDNLSTNIMENSQEDSVVGVINISDSGDRPIDSITLSGDSATDFKVDNKGVIKVKNIPDKERKESYSLTAIANNASGNSNSATINITINNEDDVIPIIKSLNFDIDENQNLGNLNKSIVIEKEGDSSISKISLTGVGAEYFSVANDGAISLEKKLDYETQKTYNLTAVATNNAGRSSPVSLDININDIADIVPTIEDFNTTIKESLEVGDIVGNIYIISSGDGNITSMELSEVGTPFNIDSDGIITLASKVDYESGKITYNYKVLAQNDAGKSQQKDFIVNIEDVPDTVAQLDDFSANVVENSPKDKEIGAITIISQGDRDITSIYLQGDDAEYFKVDKNGSVYIVIPPDYENRSKFELKAVATTTAGDSNPSDVTINIEDIDENPPTSESFFKKIKDSDTNGTSIGMIDVDKKDSDITDVNLSGTGNEDFNIAYDGNVTIVHSENLVADKEYKLNIKFKNSSGWSSGSSVTIVVDGGDTTRPTVTITSNHDLSSDAVAYLSGSRWKVEELEYHFDFSEDVEDFNLSDINISGADSSSYNFSGGGDFYILKLKPPFNSTDSIIVNIEENVTHDSANNQNEASSIIIQSVDTYQPFITVWKSDNNGDSDDNQIKINVESSRNDYNFSIDWGDGSVNYEVTDDITHTYNAIGEYTIKVKGDFPQFLGDNISSNDVEKLIQIKQWGTIEWQSMKKSFAGCKNLDGEIIDTPNLSNVTDLSYMFMDADKFNQYLSNWEVSNIQNMQGIFKDTLNFNGNIESWVVNNVENMESMFENADAFNQDITGWEVTSVTDMDYMFKDTANFDKDLTSWDNDINGNAVSHTDFDLSATGGLTPPNW